jgi:outer membrane protein OmpA-like peptidoglycan-associated protein
MRHLTLALVLITMGSPAALAQQGSTSSQDPSRFQVSAGYDYVRANAPPPGVCQCFGLQGGYFSVDFGIDKWVSIEAEVTGQHGNDISALGQDLTLFTFAAGPKIHHQIGKFEPFGQVLVGGARGSDSYFPTATSSNPTATSFAVTLGGGLDYLFSKHFSVRIFDVQFLKTELPNGVNNEQDQLMGSAGIVYRFHKMHSDDGGGKPPAVPQLALSCTSNVDSVYEGDTLQIVARSISIPANLMVTYEWKPTAGSITGTGDHVSIDTAGLSAGDYHVVGHATAQGASPLSADCDVSFRIKAKPEVVVAAPTPVAAAAPAPIAPVDANREFHDNVPDALFDFDSAAIRPDAQVAITHAADYLQKHPEIGVQLGGFADNRGSAKYNLVLGEKRAEAAREALVAAGVQADRLQVISYGKEVQVCTPLGFILRRTCFSRRWVC